MGLVKGSLKTSITFVGGFGTTCGGYGNGDKLAISLESREFDLDDRHIQQHGRQLPTPTTSTTF